MARKFLRKLPKILKAVIVCFMLLLFLSFDSLRNNWTLRGFEQSIAALKHPPGTGHHYFVSDVGNLFGVSNQINFFAGEVRSYSGSKSKVRAFYANSAVWNPVSYKNERLKIAFDDEISNANANSDADTISWLDGINQWHLFPKGAKNYYIIYLFDGVSPGFDLRGY